MTDHAAAPQPHDPAAGPAPDEAPAPAGASAPAAAEAPAAPAADSPWAADAAAEAPAAQAAVPAETEEERAARRTRRRKAAVRWSCAVLVFALAGTGTALAVTAPDRTDIPGLATASDGRYTFPPLALPPLPSGKAAPDLKDKSTDKGADQGKHSHQADLRHLLLPAPKEAGGSLNPPVFPAPTASASASASATAAPSDTPSAGPTASASASAPASAAPAGAVPADWVPCDAMTGELQNPARLRELLLQYVCRGATVREWTASDGTSTRIRLLRFASSSEAWSTFSRVRSEVQLKVAPDARTVQYGDWGIPEGVELTSKESRETVGKDVPTTRVAYVSASDVIAVVTMTNPHGVPAAAFRQVVTLQSDLLG
ncbi:hypothetical protein ABTZ03_17430 [Kitasatospora sp. NPDC096077]|uniref:hypothetical protein n=1 Tax=Kitasatospora sp. NPDC096077 TaxID=3155544 RepID=UPI00333434C9